MKSKRLLILLLMALLVPWAANAQVQRLSENFDNMSSLATTYSAKDWYAYNAHASNPRNWTLSTSYAYGGSGQCARYSYSSTYAADCYLVSAPFSVGNNMQELNVSLYENTGSYTETFEVFFVKASDVTDDASITTATQYNAIASADYNNTSYAEVNGSNSNAALAGQSVRVVVHCTSARDEYWLAIDNITVIETSTDPSISLSPSSITVFTGFTQTLTATPTNVTGTPAITYTSSNDNVATVSGNGTTATVTAVAPGTATITATMTYNATDYTATCAVTVEAPHYCTPSYSYANTNYGIYIMNFSTTMGDPNINNTSSLSTGGYGDYYDTYSATVEAGQSIDFIVNPNGTVNNMIYAVWIDWNQDYDFEDEGELVAQQTSGIMTGWIDTISIPAATPGGNYRMRVEAAYTGSYGGVAPCISSTYGEAEDYKLVVLPASACPKPNGLQVTDITARSAKLSWNSDGNAWNIGYKTVGGEERYVAVTENPYTLTGLSPETEYQVRVQNDCGGGTYSIFTSFESFTTDVSCHAPTALQIEDITTETANFSWTGESDNYDIRYGLYPDSNLEEKWLTYNVTTNTNSYGSEASSTKTWGTMYPGDQIMGNILSKVKLFYNPQYNTNNTITINVYSGGDNAPETLLYTEVVTPAETVGFQTFTLASPVNIISRQNLWITITETGTFCLQVGACTDDNNRWIVNNGNWTTWTVAGLGWMIEGLMETKDFESISWTTASVTSSTYQLQNLNPASCYLAQVRANCGGEDGTSIWMGITFSTLATCLPVENLAVVPNSITAYGATFTWDAEDTDQFQYCIFKNPTEGFVPEAAAFTNNNVTGDTIILNNVFDADSDYGFYLRRVCDNDDYSEIASVLFHTDLSCYPPTGLTVAESEITATTAPIRWTSTADNFDIRYSVIPDNGMELGYDNGTNISAFKNCYAGVMFPVGQFTQDHISKVSLYDYGTTTGTCQLYIYNDGATAPENLVYSSEITLTGTNSFADFAVDATVDNTKNVWVVLYFASSGSVWKLPVCTNTGDANGRWFSTNGIEWIDITNLDDTYNYTWMIRATFDNASDYDWETRTSETTNYTLTGLTAESDYMVQVRTNCGVDDGVSTWISALFSTLTSCPAPDDLDTREIEANSVTVRWNAHGTEAWNLRYGTDGQTWTTLTEGITNPYTLEGLTSSTYYYLQVQAQCNTEVWSDTLNFTTACGSVTAFPWTENFNSLTVAYSIPICWDNDEGTASGDSYKWCYDPYGDYSDNGDCNGTSHDESNCVRFDSYGNSSDVTNFLKTPTLSLPDETAMQLTFWYKNPAGGDFSVYISTDGGATHTVALAEGLTDVSEWTQHEAINLSTYAGQEVVIVFKGTSNWGYGDAYIYLDDVTVEEVPSCAPPTVNNATDITTTSAKLSWTANTGETEWTVYYKKTADANYTEVPEVTENPYTLEGLVASTYYDFYVVANCSETETSDPSAVKHFVTECEVIVVDADHPYTEDFEGTIFPPICWEAPTVEYYDYGYYTTSWTASSYYNHTENGTGSAYSYYYGGDDGLYLVMPDIQLSNNGNSAQLTFWSYNDYPSFYEKNSVVLLDGEEEIELWSPTSVTSSWKADTIDLTAYMGQTITLAFKYEGDYAHAWYVDDVEVSVAPFRQDIALSAGWNWVSLYVGAETPVAMLDKLKEALGDKALTIKSRTDYTEYFGEEWGWYGDLDDIGVTNKETIMIEASEAGTVTVVGDRVEVEQVSITIRPGWNWIGFPSAEGMTPDEAFSGFRPEDGDMLKDKVSYATYYDGYGWYEEGGLVTMEPGHGFMYYSNSTTVKTLVFSTTSRARR